VRDIDATTLLLDRADAVLWIRLYRPDARNGIDPTMRDELTAVLCEADAETSVRAVVITGTGRDFCTGADLMPAGHAGGAAQRPLSTLDYRRAVGPFQRLFQTLWELETPVVSAVNGTTAGAGWMLALLADLVVAAEGARWTHVFARRGMVPHAGDPFFLPRVLPFHRLLEAALLSDTLTSETLHEWGAVNRLVPAEEVEPTARELAARLAAGPTAAYAGAKEQLNHWLFARMDLQLELEAATQQRAAASEDFKEGVMAFLQKRQANFEGR
jgi:2-(1,2-epoxy-1,2-dihydrophenyl)acetyl-CoA isomerase